MCDRELVTEAAAAPLPYSIDSPITGCDGVLTDRYKNALITVKELGPGQSLIAPRALNTQLWTHIVLSPLDRLNKILQGSRCTASKLVSSA